MKNVKDSTARLCLSPLGKRIDISQFLLKKLCLKRERKNNNWFACENLEADHPEEFLGHYLDADKQQFRLMQRDKKKCL